jgi:hypothetical protein
VVTAGHPNERHPENNRTSSRSGETVKALRIGKAGAAAGLAAAALALSVLGASSASADDDTPRSHDEQIIDMQTCQIRGENEVANGTYRGFTCTQQLDGTAILTWW